MCAALLASFFYGVSHVYGKKFFTGHPPFVAPTASLAMSSLFLCSISLLTKTAIISKSPSSIAIAGICGLAVFGSVIAFTIYYKLLEESGPTAVSLVACFFPVGGILLGVIFLGESLTLSHVISSIVIVVGIGIVNQVIPLSFLEPKKSL